MQFVDYTSRKLENQRREWGRSGEDSYKRDAREDGKVLCPDPGHDSWNKRVKKLHRTKCTCVAKLLQSYPTFCDPMDCSLSGSSVHGDSPARILEWVAMPSSRRFSWPRDQTCVSCGLLHGRWIPYHWASFIYLYLAYLFFFGVPLLYNVVLVSAVK